MKLVIVESPTKAKTISRFLDKNYTTTSSYGHIRDLPKGELGVDVENNFKPKYVIPIKVRKNVTALKKLAAAAEDIILATDEDREGEAIAWHITQALDLKDKKVFRIVFHEITKSAIKEALEHPRQINKNLVNAQQARRILDRLVGYKLSPLLWKKIMRGLSAGRVQSIALRLIVEREEERKAFTAQKYWTVTAQLKTENKESFEAKLWKRNDKVLKELELDNIEGVDKILEDLKSARWSIAKITKKETKRNPLPPFTTSTLQQFSNHRLHFSAKQTMLLAQQLYEGIKLDREQVGLITYMRTDSFNLSNESKSKAKTFIENVFGREYSQERTFKTKSKSAQEAHEAIRPTDPARTPEGIKEFLDPKQFKLYSLIWQRFIASQMTPAVFEATTIEIATETPYEFKATGSVKKFDGFLKVWQQKENGGQLPDVKDDEKLELEGISSEEHETMPPPRYNEASLVKSLEEAGIGRPSTYAPTMSTIQNRNYVEKDEQKRFFPSEIGIAVNNLLVKNFPKIVDIDFTANMERDLDEIAEGKKEWEPIIREFYTPFIKLVEEKTETLKKSDFKKDTPTDKICPDCGKSIVIKFGRFGKFYACSGWPDCKHTENFIEKIDMKCPKCKTGDVALKKTKRKRKFYGCSRYPDCDYASWKNPKEVKNVSESDNNPKATKVE